MPGKAGMKTPGSGGRPTPTAVLKARGSWRAKEREKTEPQIEPGIPSAPIELKGKAKRVWTQMCKDLEAIGVLTRVDGKALARYCKGWVQWLEMADYNDGRLKIETVEDLGIVHKHFDKMIKLSEHLLRFEMQYGLTPSSRASVRRIEKPKTKGKGELFKAG